MHTYCQDEDKKLLFWAGTEIFEQEIYMYLVVRCKNLTLKLSDWSHEDTLACLM